ncbi:hypothetical protein PRZ48_001293 [Zasmidium cellare]|uniref:Rrn9 domain-containing protein n=1 Tax=Zasmidium cellare TaxID=395010 RepID=A0ABR0F277_ZASCE|nr:hypothetical protein PRZ48_001293 [Zasmidium cellare]
MSSIGDDAEAEVQDEIRDASSGSDYEDEAKPQDEDYDEDSESEREGRFHGPDSSWRFYTKEERAIVSSLDQAENNDLSAHLYNAHVWKQGLRDVERMRDCLPWHGKHRWIQPEDNGKLPFLPPAAWTAWPLRPEDVPRSQEQWGIPAVDPDVEASTFTKAEPWRPGLHLQEELKAIFLRRAKESFRERERADAVKKQDVAHASGSKTPVSFKSRPRHSGSEQTDDGDESDEDEIDQQKVKKENSDDDDVDMESVNDQESVSDQEIDDVEYLPSFLLDDDQASSILEPTVHHIIAKFNDLLIGLHKSRLGHHQDRSRSRGSSAGSRLHSKSRERPRSAASVPAKRKRAASDIKVEDAMSESEDAESESDEDMRTGRDPQPGGRRRMLAPRDWSEVLGIAAMVGWDQDILDRAARRCAATFGESMTMRVMPETSFGNTRDQVVEYVPIMIPPIDESASDDNDMESDEESKEPPSLACREPSCRRHSKPFGSTWRLREHLKRKHKFSKEQIDRVAPRLSAPTSRTRAIKTEPTSDAEEEEEEEEEGDKLQTEGEEAEVEDHQDTDATSSPENEVLLDDQKRKK